MKLNVELRELALQIIQLGLWKTMGASLGFQHAEPGEFLLEMRSVFAGKPSPGDTEIDLLAVGSKSLLVVWSEDVRAADATYTFPFDDHLARLAGSRTGT